MGWTEEPPPENEGDPRVARAAVLCALGATLALGASGFAFPGDLWAPSVAGALLLDVGALGAAVLVLTHAPRGARSRRVAWLAIALTMLPCALLAAGAWFVHSLQTMPFF